MASWNRTPRFSFSTFYPTPDAQPIFYPNIKRHCVHEETVWVCRGRVYRRYGVPKSSLDFPVKTRAARRAFKSPGEMVVSPSVSTEPLTRANGVVRGTAAIASRRADRRRQRFWKWTFIEIDLDTTTPFFRNVTAVVQAIASTFAFCPERRRVTDRVTGWSLYLCTDGGGSGWVRFGWASRDGSVMHYRAYALCTRDTTNDDRERAVRFENTKPSGRNR